MRKVILALLAVVQLAVVGCHHNLSRGGCRHCGQHHGDYAQGGPGGPARVPYLPIHHQEMEGVGGPPSATYTYPYYTLRAPRDFLMDNPPSIGP